MERDCRYPAEFRRRLEEGKGGAGEERGQFRRTEVRRNGGQRIRPGLFGAQADTARHPSGLPRAPIIKIDIATKLPQNFYIYAVKA